MTNGRKKPIKPIVGIYTDCNFRGAPGSKAAIVIDKDVDTRLSLINTSIEGSRYGIVQGSSGYRDRSPNGASRVKITQTGKSHVHGEHAGISVPEGSNSEVSLSDEARVTGGVYGVEERARAAEAVEVIVHGTVPRETITEVVNAVLEAKDGTTEQQEQAVKSSRIWTAIKDYGPDIAGLVIKTILKSFG